MQTMFQYSIKENVFYAQEKEKISYPVDFTVLQIIRNIFFCAHCKIYDPPYALEYTWKSFK